MRTFLQWLLAITLVLSSSLLIAEEPQELNEGFVNTFIKLYRDSPGALQRFQDQLTNANPELMDKVIDGLETTPYSYLAPVVIRANKLKAAQNLDINNLSLKAVRGGKLIDIPFQIDEFDETGLIWIEGKNKKDAQGTPGKYDGFDELVFMFRDAGLDRLDNEKAGKVKNDIVSELTVTDPDGQERYAYLVKQKPEKTNKPYVSVDLDKGEIKSTVFELDFNPKNLLDVNQMTSTVGPEAGEDLLNDLSVRLSTGILNKNLRFSLEVPKNIRALPRGVKSGPVRSTVLIRARVWYLGIPTLLTHPMQVQFYEQATNIPVTFDISSIGTLGRFVGMLKEPDFQVSLRLNNSEGADVTFENMYSEHQDFAHVDGKLTSFEQLLNKQRMPGDWISVDSNKGWSFMFSHGIPVTEDGLFDRYLDDTESKMIYNEPRVDDKLLLELGFEGRNLPKKVFKLLKSAPSLPKKINQLGEAFLYYEKQGRDGKLEKYDDIVNDTLKDFASSNDKLIDAFITDMSRMEYIGIPKNQLNDIIQKGLQKTLDLPNQPLEHGKILTQLVDEAKQQGVDWNDLHHAIIPITLWFPHKIGEQPNNFHRQQDQGIDVSAQPWRP